MNKNILFTAVLVNEIKMNNIAFGIFEIKWNKGNDTNA